ncbi:hypothetical protein PENTCL1PPCAC_15090, partial [Pristionchus entomophagus]
LLFISLFSLVHTQCPGGIPAAEVSGFLDVHYKLRQSISAGTYVAKGRSMPAAKTPIANLMWDCDIERSAQAAANTCVFEHSKNRTNLGENLFMSSSSLNGKGKAASDSWESEFQTYGWPDIKANRADNEENGHATQMAWAKTAKIGCGMASCSGRRFIVVCQYRDAGNFIGQNVYEPLG